MPVKLDDAAQHAAGLPNISDRIAAIFATLRSRLQQVDGRDSLAQLVSDLDQHHDLLVNTVAGDYATRTAGARGPLGPGETPYVPGDRPVSVLESDRHSNPIAPRDSSGFKVHPADAASLAAKMTNPAGGQGFGGNGMGASADVRTQAALAARDIPTRSLQEDQASRQRTEQDANRAAGQRDVTGQRAASDKKLIPVIQNEIVAGSEVERGGVRYVTKRRGDGTEYEAIDTRPLNEPV